MDLNPEHLLKKTSPFNFDNPQIDPYELEKELKAALLKYGGLGIAANQLGLNLSVAAIGPKKDIDSMFVIFNPVIFEQDEKTVLKAEEGCLSYPGVFMSVARPSWIRVRYQTVTGEMKREYYENYAARILMHEIDHLNGITFGSRVSRLVLERSIKKANKLGFKYSMRDFRA